MTNTSEPVAGNALTDTWKALQQSSDLVMHIAVATSEMIAKGARSLGTLPGTRQGNVDALTAAGRVSARGMRELTQATVAYARSSIDETQLGIQKLASAKSPAEFLTIQSEFVRRQLESGVVEVSRIGETVRTLIDEIATPSARAPSGASGTNGTACVSPKAS